MIKPIIYKHKEYIPISQFLLEDIGLTKSQKDTQVKRLTRNPIIGKYCTKSPVNTRGGVQESLILPYKLMGLFLGTINTTSFTSEQKINFADSISVFTNVDIDCKSDELSKFDYESKLRDEIFDSGYFENIRIYEKEKVYEFGRIDLYGIDCKRNKCCIELKKNKDFTNTKEQLIKYKNSKMFNRVIFCAYDISTELYEFCRKSDIEIYTYKRKLVLEKQP